MNSISILYEPYISRYLLRSLERASNHQDARTDLLNERCDCFNIELRVYAVAIVYLRNPWTPILAFEAVWFVGNLGIETGYP